MTLAAGTTLGSYQILSAIGAGGMGEVYRARDTRLHREVAVKVLPESFALDPERLTRFEREAQALASLNHPNIAQIYGVEQCALVMELVEGEDLAQRIARGALPIEEALQIAKQIADALDTAHESGIIHRDLKPANIKLRDDGVVKVLDFGLAKAVDAAPAPASGPELPNSPTFTSPAMMTRMGVILGTAAYMSPEQARGKGVDRRSDLWAFGVVLYEMLTGRMVFEGDTITDVLAAIVTKEPDWTALPSNTPPAVRRLLQRCLTRDPRRRLSAAAEAKYQIEDALAAPAEARESAGAVTQSSATALAMVVPWAVAVVFAAVAAYAWLRPPRGAEEDSLHYSVEPPSKSSVNIVNRPAIALSRDGRRLAFIATNNGVTRLYVRARDDFDARALAGTEGASEPVFSPDGRWLAFFANNALYRISIDGGPTEMLARVNDPRGLSWDANEVITYSPEATAGVFQLDPNRPAPTAITTLKPPQERTHRWPQALPGNKAVLFTVGSISSPDNYDAATIEAVVLATNERRVLLKGAAMARYFAPGYLVFARGPSVFAVRFNLERLEVEGAPAVVIQGVGGDSTTGASNFVFSDTGTLAYFPGFAVGTQHRLVWASRDGTAEPIALPAGGYFDIRLSPDGRRVALQSVAGAGSDIWVHDFAKKTFTRLTFGGQNRTPIWSRDGSLVYYVSLDPIGDRSRIFRRPADGSRDAEKVADVGKFRIFLKGLTDEGRSALIEYSTNANKTDIGTLALGPNKGPTPIITSEFDEYGAALAPNGRWIAYQSDESSRAEIYVREVGGKGGRWQISSEGGEEPHWSSKGDELYYRNDTLFMAAHIETGSVFQSSPPRKVFDGVFNLRAESGISFDVDPAGGSRFVMIRLAAESVAPSSIRVITNWSRELARVMTRPQ